MIYLLLIILFLIPLFAHFPKKASNRYYWGECLAIILVMGFRYYVGGDTIGYMAKYEYTSPIYDLTALDFLLGEYQPLWTVLQSSCKAISDEFFVLQLVVSFVINVSVFWVMAKYSINRFLAVFLYLIALMLNFNCEILRAVIAISIFFIAYEQLLQKHYFKYYLLIVVAILFHDQAALLLFVPLFFSRIQKPINPIAQVCLFIIGLILTLPPIMQLYVPYLPGERGETFTEGYGSMHLASILGYLHVLVNIILLNFVIRSGAVKENSKILPALNLYLCCTILGFGMPIFSTRVSQFFVVYYLCALSTFILYYKKGFIKAAVILVWIFGVYRYYSLDVTSWVRSESEGSGSRYYFYEIFYPYYSIWDEPDPVVMSRRKDIADQEILKLNK